MAKKDLKENFIFLPSISKKAIPSLLKEADILYIGAVRNKMFRFGICMNKLFDSMMSGKPILYAVDAPNNYIRDYSCGISVEAENTNALIKGIQKLVQMPEAERNEMGVYGRKAVMTNFTYDVLAAKFASLFEK